MLFFSSLLMARRHLSALPGNISSPKIERVPFEIEVNLRLSAINAKHKLVMLEREISCFDVDMEKNRDWRFRIAVFGFVIVKYLDNARQDVVIPNH
jgi:hypothetical protein